MSECHGQTGASEPRCLGDMSIRASIRPLNAPMLVSFVSCSLIVQAIPLLARESGSLEAADMFLRLIVVDNFPRRSLVLLKEASLSLDEPLPEPMVFVRNRVLIQRFDKARGRSGGFPFHKALCECGAFRAGRSRLSWVTVQELRRSIKGSLGLAST